MVDAVARLAVPAYADWCFVELLQPDGSIVREAMAHADPERLALGRTYDRLFPLDPEAPVGSPHVIRTGEPELTPEIPEEFLAAAAHDDDEYLAALRELAFRSALIVPLRARGRVIGDLALASLGVRPPLRPRRRSRSRRSWPTAARWRWTTRGCTPSCARPRRRRGGRARR